MNKWLPLLSLVLNMPLGGEPLDPEESTKAFQLESPELKISLVASEPQVIDPVAMCFDEKGRIFVVENRRYPNPGREMPTGAKLGKIAMLEDKDCDGHYESRTTFAKEFTFPNGILPWGGGFFVTSAPDIYYLKDTNGDGVADLREVVFTGFGTNSSSEQLRVASPTLGPDGWVYLTSGLSDGKVTSPKHPNRPPVEAKRSDWRFHPQTLEIQAISGTGQFGQAFDNLGRRFVCDNRHPVRWVVFTNNELAKYPGQAMMDLADAGAATPLYPLSPDTTAAGFHTKLMHNLHAGTFTSCSGLAFYSGDKLPNHRGNFFICEPAQNLVHSRSIIETDGTLTSKASAEGREFLASPDQWFRPVFACNGPDGALYICDMYRKYVDHPNYLPPEAATKLDFNAGKQQGRIWKVTSCSQDKPMPLPDGQGLSQHIREAKQADGDLKKVANLAEKAGANEWFQAVALVSTKGKENEFLSILGPRIPPSFIEEAAKAGAQGNLKPSGNWTPVQTFAFLLGSGVRPASEHIDKAKAILVDPSQPTEARLYALELLGKYAPALLFRYIAPQETEEIRHSAIRAVAGQKDEGLGQKLLALRNNMGPESSSVLVDALTQNRAHHAILLNALESGELPQYAIALNQHRRFTSNPAVKERAEKLFQATESSDRMKVFDDFKVILQLEGNAATGKEPFARTCASCHKFKGLGHEVGPDLNGLKNQPEEALLLHILVPNREVYPTFAFYQATTKDGQAFAGILSGESASFVTLKLPLGQKATISRDQIKSLQAMPVSLMPDGLEQSMTRQELRDLLAFLKN